ncbi:MAG TPA: serine hydrolase domain-containing protein, partial [Thermoanaerobaculia bacterium]|nr:serine hydrolase domain-containing protein [Thermoanaerobaculia bacterium]
ALLALIVEKVSGESFPSFLEGNIFAPLSMNGSVAHVEGVSRVSNRAFGYVRDNGGWVRRDQSITSAVLGDGGVYSNIEDLARWDDALRESRVVSPGTVRLATSALIATDVPGVGYGFGWRIGTHRGRRQFWHTGETSGFRNAIIRFPDDRVTVVVLTNRGEGRPYETALKISELYLD